MLRRTILVILLAAFASTFAAEVKVSLLTCYPGDEVYELDGHSALRLRSDAFDVALSWGVFNFNAPNFVYRFVKGETDYMVAEIPTSYFLYDYARKGRKVVEQDIQLDSLQAARLVQLVQNNLRPENRVYRYNYVKDNCATRPLLMIETARDSAFSMSYVSPDRTFRQVMQRYHAAYPWYQFGIDLALGPGIDYTFSPREQAFSPMLLMKMLPYPGHVIVDGPDTGSALPPTPWWLTPMTVMLVVMALTVASCAYSIIRRRMIKWVHSAFYAAIGILGCVTAFLVLISVHEATSPNWLFLFFNPLCLIPAVFIWVKKARKLVICYQILNFALIIFGVLLWPFTGQYMNPAILPILVADISLAATYLHFNLKRNSTNATQV